MTTIAWRDGVLAVDNQSTIDGTVTKQVKLFERHGHAIALCGDTAEGRAFLEWFSDGRAMPCPLTKHSHAVVMSLESGKCEWWWAPGRGIEVCDEFAADGSGKDYAYGAMAMGADAVKAVEVAGQFDIYTGFGVCKMTAVNWKGSRRD